MSDTQQHESNSASNLAIDPAELEYLNRLFSGRHTEAQAKQHAAAELAKHDGIVNSIETDLTKIRASLGTLHLGLGDKRAVQRTIDRLEWELSEAHRVREKAIRLNGASIKDSKETDKLRPRWDELKKREQLIINMRRRLPRI